VVALNMSGAEQKVNLDLSKQGFSSAKNLVATGKSAVAGNVITLEPYGVLIGQLSK
jgi:hypothetical protein